MRVWERFIMCELWLFFEHYHISISIYLTERLFLQNFKKHFNLVLHPLFQRTKAAAFACFFQRTVVVCVVSPSTASIKSSSQQVPMTSYDSGALSHVSYWRRSRWVDRSLSLTCTETGTRPPRFTGLLPRIAHYRSVLNYRQPLHYRPKLK